MNHIRKLASWRGRALSLAALTAALATACSIGATATSLAAPARSANPTTTATDSAIRADAQRLLKAIDAGGSLKLAPGVLGALRAQGKLLLREVSGGQAAKLCAADARLVRLQDLTSPLTRATRVSVRQFAATIGADILGLRAQLLSQPGTRSCGGAGGTSPVATPVVKISSASTREVTLHIAFPAPVFAAKQGDGREYTELFEQGFGTQGTSAIGNPELPVTGETVAVPAGASASVKVLRSTSYLLSDALLWPLQPMAAAPAARPAGNGKGGPLDPPPPFAVNRKSYLSDASSPAVLATAGKVGSMRGLRLTTIRLAGAPRTGQPSASSGSSPQWIFG